MNTNKTLICLTLIGCLATFSARTMNADILTIDTSMGDGQVGGYYGLYDPIVDDPPDDYPPILAPDIDASFQNYFLGRTTLGPLGTSIATPERRAFFIFDTSTISIPDGQEIANVSIDLEVLFGGVLANFEGGIEVVEFSSTPFSAGEILDPDSAAIPYEVIWDTFGMGTPYGAFEFFADDAEEPTLPGIYTVDLAGAVDHLSDAIATGDAFIVTARLATFDPGPIGKDASIPGVEPIDPYEFVFGLTDIATPSGSPTTGPPVLTITTVPEPSGFVGVCLVLGLFGFRRKSKALRSRLAN